MIIYIIIKMIVSYYLDMKKKKPRLAKIVDIGIDVGIIAVFIYFFWIQDEKMIMIDILYRSLFLIFMFFTYRSFAYMLGGHEKIIGWIEKKEKIRLFLLKPKVNKIIYYFIWFLPWNIGYWTYFWIMENGWYLRVWVVSNRDIFFMRYFGWDSRDFFYKFNKSIMDKKISKVIIEKRDKIYEMIYRIMYLLYWIRKGFFKIKVGKYIWIRLVIFMYLTMFYFYGFFYLYVFSYYMFIGLIVLELCILYHAKIIIIFWQSMNKEEWTDEGIEKNKKEGIIAENLLIWLKFVKYPMHIEEKYKWEIPTFIWDKTLSNSVTLNILYKYMIWVNKNTEGYYDRKMNIRSRIHRRKYVKEESIIWDVLPRTRYVVMDLKNRKYNSFFDEWLRPKYENTISCLSNNKNFYLSYYEKAYSKTSLLMLIYTLRTNNVLWIFWNADSVYSLKSRNIEFFSKYEHNIFITYTYLYHILMNILVLQYIYEKDKRLISSEFLKEYINRNDMIYELEEYYIMKHLDMLEEKKSELKIPQEFCGIKDYKVMFAIMGKMQRYEEEAIVWNNSIQEFLNDIEKEKYKDGMLQEKYKDIYDWADYGFVWFLDPNRFEVLDWRFLNFLKKLYMFITILNDDVEKIKDVDCEIVESLFLKRYADDDLLEFLYLYSLILFLGWNSNFQCQTEPTSEYLDIVFNIPEELDYDELKKKFF